MKIEQIYTGCLAEAAYYIESNGEAAIVDPLREVAPYLDRAKEDGAVIKYVLETHFHADFVSGHIDLAKKTGASIVFGPTAQPNFTAHVAEDGEDLKIGQVTLRVLHTPGHTMESSTFLLLDECGRPHAIFTGDTLFIGDVGRPDLAVKSDLTREDLARHLFDSLRHKIMSLPDDIIVYPGHGAGSACGKKMSKETSDTLGHQKLFNYALRADMTKEEFVQEVTDGLVEPPQYFPKNAALNKVGYGSIDEVLSRGVVPLDLQQFRDFIDRDDALILDTRSSEAFLERHIPGSIWIGIDDSFAPWVGALIPDLLQKIVFVAGPGREEEVVVRLARVGYDYALGFLSGGVEAWSAGGLETEQIASVPADEFAMRYNDFELDVLDVRKESEYNSQHLVRAVNFPLDFINQEMGKLDASKEYYIHCQGGYRSVIAASILKARGFELLINVEGGFKSMKDEDLPLTAFETPITML
ncbi:MAG: MBL fold metallo-hydrolase [Bacteroidota bacterium]